MKLPEPVARVILVHQPLRSNEYGSWQMEPQLEAHLITKWDNGDSLYTAAQMIAFRNAALEEAAKVCEQFIHYGEASGIICVKAIRELKEVQS